MIPLPKIMPRPYQIKGTQWLLSRPEHAGMLADEQGTGKTIQAIFAAANLKGPILVICRPIAKPDWRKWIRELDPTAEIVTAVPGGVYNVEKVKKWFATRKRGYLIIHHETLVQPKVHSESAKRRAVQKGRRLPERTNVAAELGRYGIWEAIIADEAHRFRNKDASMRIGFGHNPAWNRWALTGTPPEKS